MAQVPTRVKDLCHEKLPAFADKDHDGTEDEQSSSQNLDIHCQVDTTFLSDGTSYPMRIITNSATDQKTAKGGSIAATSTPADDGSSTVVEPFPLMQLPQEIRLMIYREFLVLPGEIGLMNASRAWRDTSRIVRYRTKCSIHQPMHSLERPFNRSVLGIFLVSKCVDNEARALFFRHNDFYFERLEHLEAFLSAISVSSRRSLVSISFKYYGLTPATSIKSLKECVGLRNLKLVFSINSIGKVSWQTDENELDGYAGIVTVNGMSDLLKVRDIKTLDVVFDEPFERNYSPRFRGVPLKEALEILKEPRKASQLTRQRNKDYPEPVGRTVFGKANVTTRGEKKVMGDASA